MTIDAQKIEFFVFIAVAIWLVYNQFGPSRRSSEEAGQPIQSGNEDQRKSVP